jgi:hypothetical protein
MTTQLLYLLGSLAGVAAMVGLCALLFGRAVAIVDARSAEESLRADVPGFRMGTFTPSSDQHAALVEDARDGSAYLVIARGRGLVTRKLSRDLVNKALREGPSLDLRLADFTFPKARITFAEEMSAQGWEARFTRMSA